MTDAAWAPDLVIYHDKCADGIVAAWACWKRWTHEVHYLAANYGFQPPADVADKNILIVDFSYPQAQLEAMVEAGARSIVILDHHKTAQHDLAAFTLEENWPREITSRNVHVALEQLEMACCPPIVGLFDMDRSGAHMAWSFAFPSEPAPHVVVLAEQYDLWRFKPGAGDPAELLHLAFQAAGLTIREVDEIHWRMERGDMEPLNKGRAIYAWRAQLIDEIASRAHLRTVAGVEGVISVECPYSLVSAVGHYLLDKYPAAPFAAMSVTGESAVTWSLRSRDDRADVSAVAKGQGGGGHRNAAGFRIEKCPAEPAGKELVKSPFRPISTWDRRDGTVLLLVDYTNGEHPLDDATTAVTIGHNNDHNVGDDEGKGWEFAGWCWSHDHYVQGAGKVIGWMPLPVGRECV